MRKRGSRSAETSAAQRALHTLHGPEPKVFEDPFALDLAGPMRWVIGPRPLARLLQRSFPWMMLMVGHHLARARYLEERLDQLLDQGLRQYVLLGAGMDSFALRRPELADRLTVFEVDHPGTQRRKRARLKKLAHTEPAHVRYLPVDFETEALREALLGGGFRSDALTLFGWMGVAPYLTEESILATLRDVAACSRSGSEIVLDTLDRAALTDDKRSRVDRRFFRAAKRMGEPMISGFDPPDVDKLLAAAGLEAVEIVTPEAFRDRWFAGRPDRLRPWERVYVVRARVL